MQQQDKSKRWEVRHDPLMFSGVARHTGREDSRKSKAFHLLCRTAFLPWRAAGPKIDTILTSNNPH
jgi:hypothetical protein